MDPVQRAAYIHIIIYYIQGVISTPIIILCNINNNGLIIILYTSRKRRGSYFFPYLLRLRVHSAYRIYFSGVCTLYRYDVLLYKFVRLLRRFPDADNHFTSISLYEKIIRYLLVK